MKKLYVMKVGLLTLLMGSGLTNAAQAADEISDADILKYPTNSIEVGGLYSSQSSAKFGQYNGINKEGLYGNGNFNLSGGPGYNSLESAVRWWLSGTDVGTTSRSFNGKISDQGKWSFSLGYDELRHNITNTFQTPFQGEPGGNNFTLPENFGPINEATGRAGTRALSQTQLNALHTVQEYSTRQNIPVSANYFFTDELSAQFDYKHIDQSGAKLIGTGSQGGIKVAPGATVKAESVNILLNPTSYTTDNFNGTLNWAGDKTHINVGYYGSIFHDNFNSVSWQSSGTTVAPGAACSGAKCYTNNTMSTAPSNVLHQFNLNGSYNLATATKLVGAFAYGFNTQNDSFAPTNILQNYAQTPNNKYFNVMQANGLPQSSLNGQVQTTHADIKLTDQSFKDWTLSAGFKFNERDNQTNSSTYKYYTLGNDPAIGNNLPYSNRKSQYELAAAYRLTKNQNIRLAYERESIDRWCNSVANGAQCLSSPNSNEDKINVAYRLKAFDDVNFNASYNYGNRQANNIHNYLFSSYRTTPNDSLSAVNGFNYLGFIAYPYVNRQQNLGKAGINWQLTDKFEVGLNGNYTYDNYDASLGVQNRRSAGVNLDATYQYLDNSSVSAYWSWQNGYRNMQSGRNGTVNKVSTQVWNNQLDDTSNGFGILSRHTGFLDGNLDIIGDVSYSIDTSSYSTQVPYLATCGASNTLTCGNLPAIKNELLSLKLTGIYKVHKNAKVALTYMYQQLSSNDYFYNAQQIGYTNNGMMPTGLQPQSYAVDVVALSYNYSF